MSNEWYNGLKQVVQLGLPAAGALYFSLSQIWGLPNGEEVVGTIAAVNLFLGVVLGYSNAKYNASDRRFDGAIEVTPLEPNADGDVYTTWALDLKSQPEDILNKSDVQLRIVHK